MKLWHDDIRKPPDESWTWARTNKEAMKLLATGEVVEASLDHDLGLDADDPDAVDAYRRRGYAFETGQDLARWMVENNQIPDKITVHSWSPPGARAIAAILNDAGTDVLIAPYEHGR